MGDVFLLTNMQMAGALWPLYEYLLKMVGPYDAKLITADGERELNATIERFAKAASIDLIDACSIAAKQALMKRLICAIEAGRRRPDVVILELPSSVDEGQRLTYSILALHPETTALLGSLFRSVN